MIVAIDGPAASGKSTTAKEVAKRLDCLYLDTGAMYRAVTLAVLQSGVDFDDDEAVKNVLSRIKLKLATDNTGSFIYLNAKDVSDAIRGMEVTQNVSVVSALPSVRKRMVQLQREIAEGKNAVVEGRDIGTVVFPDADFKFYIVADYETRAKRRQIDLEKLGIKQSIGNIVKDLKQRDKKDSERSLSPLKRADDAEKIDTTTLTIEEQINTIVEKVRSIEGG